MHHRYSLILILAAAASACSGEGEPTGPLTPPPAPTVLLRDVVIANLPSPYYHFEYDTAGLVTAASFASGFRMYEVTYDGGRITEMKNDAVGNHDRLEYAYDAAGRVAAVDYLDESAIVFTRLVFSYQSGRLTGIERQRKVTSGFVVDKTTSLSYYADGNLLEITEHRPPTDGLPETTTVDRFEQYDDRTNVDAFDLIHDDFFDHLVLLPGVRIQKGNPGRVTRTGDGTNYVVDYAYTFDDSGRPLSKSGELTLSNGPDEGRKFQVGSAFSYY